MRKPSPNLVMSVSVIITLCGARALVLGAEHANASPIVVIVDDRAQVHPRILDQAMKEAARLYRQAGVATAWRTVPAAPPLHAFTVQLIIQANLRTTGDTTSKFLMGAAPATARVCGGSVYVFHDQVAGFSNVRQLDAGLVLGTVIAHEVGHLLLRQRGHSAEGLMRASWDSGDWQRAVMGFLLFSSDDGATIRSTISSCRQ